MNYIITEEELTSLEKTGNPSYKKSVDYVIGRIRSRPVMPDKLLTGLANELSTCDDGVQYCDICDHYINPDKFDLRDHTKECLLHRIATLAEAIVCKVNEEFVNRFPNRNEPVEIKSTSDAALGSPVVRGVDFGEDYEALLKENSDLRTDLTALRSRIGKVAVELRMGLSATDASDRLDKLAKGE